MSCLDSHPIHELYKRQLCNIHTTTHNINSAWSKVFFDKLNLEKELRCHDGCVNCIQWSRNGQYLLSGSDDTFVCVWEPLRTDTQIAKIPSHHKENIFSVKFINAEKQVISGAGDGEVRHLDIASGDVLSSWRCHRHRVKRCCTVSDEQMLVISSSEDGTARQFDVREGHTCSSSDSGCCNALIVLNKESIKSINSNPVKPYLLCVGAGDSVARVYDRRMLSLTSGSTEVTTPLQTYLPGHLHYKEEEEEESATFSSPSITWCTFDPTGELLLCNMGGEQIYLYNLDGNERAIRIPVDMKNKNDFKSLSHKNQDLDEDTIRLKNVGNALYNRKDYVRAVAVYSECIRRCSKNVFLYNNRAQALLKRGWRGDKYAALRDTVSAIQLQPHNEKSHFRQLQCLEALGFVKAAQHKLSTFKSSFSSNDNCLKTLSNKIAEAIENNKKEPVISSNQYKDSLDYNERYCGHCNCKTDIKEANFFGPNQEYIVAGSDDKFMFFWDRKSGTVLKCYKGDATLVNCVQPHPTLPFIASSGLESVVKLWSPQQSSDRQMIDDPDQLSEIASRNQKTMDSTLNLPSIFMMQNHLAEMFGPEGPPNSCNPS